MYGRDESSSNGSCHVPDYSDHYRACVHANVVDVIDFMWCQLYGYQIRYRQTVVPERYIVDGGYQRLRLCERGCGLPNVYPSARAAAGNENMQNLFARRANGPEHSLWRQ